MITNEIRTELFRLRDEQYGDFLKKLIPTVSPDALIGVRTPALRAFAGRLAKREDVDVFLDDLPHAYFDENQLHAFILSEMKNYDRCMERLCAFLPHVDNWATCDQMSPKVFRKHKSALMVQIEKWLSSGETYTVRFAVGMLMEHYLDEDFDLAYPQKVAAIRSDAYYVKMMVAWYFATALAKQYDAVFPFLTQRKLDVWTHNKTIQKATESRRISPAQKADLLHLKI